MRAQLLVQTQRTELVRVLGGGAADGLESVLDLLLAWDVLLGEDYESLRAPGQALHVTARELLDLLWSKGEMACQFLLTAIGQVLPQDQKAGLSLGNCSCPVRGAEQIPSTGTRTLQRERPSLVRKLHGNTGGALRTLREAGCFSAYDCDEVLLPIYTPSQQARRLLDLAGSKGEAAAEVLLSYIQQTGKGPTQPLTDDTHKPDPVPLTYQRKLRSMVSAQSRFLSMYGGMENLSLEDIYTEGVLEVAQGSGEPQRPLGLEDILSPVGVVNKEADTVLISGEAGSGKSTLLQRLHLLWAGEAALQDFVLLFPFSCRRLSAMHQELCLRELLFQHCCWPDADQDLIFHFILDQPHRVLFTFDGLDELRMRFTDEQGQCSPTQPTSVPTMLFSLFQGSLMKGVCKLVTSRPDVVGPSLRKYIRKEVSLRGFSQDGISSFVKKHHSDPSIATCVMDTLRGNTALLGLCHIPVFCWIVSKCHEELLGRGGGSPQTITDVYLMILQHFLQHSHPQQCPLGATWMHDHAHILLHLGRLALGGLVSSSYVFSDLELQQCGVTEEDLFAGFLVLVKSLSSRGGKHYEFLHLTVQCFFAGLFIVLDNNLSRSTIPQLFHPQRKQPSALACVCLGPCLHSGARQDAGAEGDLREAETPNLQMTATFVAGLLSQRHRGLLLLYGLAPTSLDRKCKQVVKCLSKGMQRHFKSIPPPVEGEKKSMHAMPEFVWLIKCIYEMQESSIAKEAMAKVEVEHLKLTYCGIGPVECTALSFVLRHLRSPVGLQLDYNSVGDVGIEQLLPCLDKCHSIYLRHNNVSDEGISKLIERGIECEHFQKIALGNNHITAQGAEQLAEGLRESRSLQYLGLWGNKIGDQGTEALAEALEKSPSLVWLSLVDNGVSSSGARALTAVIKNSSTLEELWLTNNSITREGVLCLMAALEKNTSVKAIWLRGNDLTAEDIEELAHKESRLTL
ncbi:nucleotide-binding oligomerization domain-containing protein 2 isoform X2 [Lepisosteus oculatus]|uniref:nucleotide-binding oligomerization domain-containing protein 2 isoform X2 n=1 Tax=Lepisosteus oculatus TaxID=7918 RepID=UPI0035F52335